MLKYSEQKKCMRRGYYYFGGGLNRWLVCSFLRFDAKVLQTEEMHASRMYFDRGGIDRWIGVFSYEGSSLVTMLTMYLTLP